MAGWQEPGARTPDSHLGTQMTQILQIFNHKGRSYTEKHGGITERH